MSIDKKISLKEYNQKLKRHLSNDYVRLSEKRTELESQLVQLKVDKDRRDKKLFQNVGQVNVKKYFSPLNIDDSLGKSNDEKLEQLKSDIQRIEDEIKNISANMIEIQEILKGADTFLGYKERRYQAGQKEEDSARKESESKKQLEKEMIHPRLEKNLKEMVRVYQDQYEYIDIILDFKDNNITLDEKINKNLLMQIVNNINTAIEEYNITMMVIQGEIQEERVDITLSYMGEDDKENTINIIYSVEF